MIVSRDDTYRIWHECLVLIERELMKGKKERSSFEKSLFAIEVKPSQRKGVCTLLHYSNNVTEKIIHIEVNGIVEIEL